MALRMECVQGLHDARVRGLTGIYTAKGYTAWCNPDGEKNRVHNDGYPDVTVKLKNEDSYYVFGVETADSITQAQAEAQWKDYSCAFQHWYLAVPAGQEETAQELLEDNGIANCTVVSWNANEWGGYTFSGLPGV